MLNYARPVKCRICADRKSVDRWRLNDGVPSSAPSARDSAIRGTRSDKNRRRMLQIVLHALDERRPVGAVDHAVVERAGDVQDPADGDLAVVHDRPVGRLVDAQDGRPRGG